MFNTEKNINEKYLLLFIIGNFVILPLNVYVFIKLNLLEPIYDLSKGLINSNLVSSLIMSFLLLWFVVIQKGHLAKEDLGLDRTKVTLATIITFFLWLLVQLISGITIFLKGKSLVINEIWNFNNLSYTIGIIIGHLFGNNFYEEVGFRSFLFIQFYLYGTKYLKKNEKLILFLSLLGSQLIFALLHIPVLLVYNYDMSIIAVLFTLLYVLFYGIFLALIYLRTENIFLCIGTHLFLNYAAPLFVIENFDTSIFFGLGLFIILIFWNKIIQHNNSIIQ